MESCITFSDCFSLMVSFFLHAGRRGKSCQSCQRCLQVWVSLAAHGCVPPWAALEPISRLHRERCCLFSCESLKQPLSSLTLSCFIKWFSKMKDQQWNQKRPQLYELNNLHLSISFFLFNHCLLNLIKNLLRKGSKFLKHIWIKNKDFHYRTQNSNQNIIN